MFNLKTKTKENEKKSWQVSLSSESENFLNTTMSRKRVGSKRYQAMMMKHCIIQSNTSKTRGL